MQDHDFGFRISDFPPTLSQYRQVGTGQPVVRGRSRTPYNACMKQITTAITTLVLTLSGAAFAGDRPATIEEFYDAGAGTRVIAHRGFSGIAPENTLAAVRAAIEVGADMVEIDVTLTADGQVVVIHDETVDRTSDGSGEVFRFKLAEIQKLDAGSWFSPACARRGRGSNPAQCGD